MTPISVCERTDFTEADLDALADLPPQLRTSEPARKTRPPTYDLVAGLHRYMACLELGHEMIPVRVELGTGPETDSVQRAADMRLWEISENLDRAELSALDRAEQIAEWVRLTEGRRAEERVSSKIETKAKTGRPEGGIRAAARELGVAKDEAHRAVKRASIAPEVKAAIRGNPTIADSGVELDALASMPAEEQQAAVAAVKGGKAATVREAAAKVKELRAATKRTRGGQRKLRKLTIPWSAAQAATELTARWPEWLVRELIAALETRYRIAAENPDAPRPARGTPPPAEPDPVDRIMALVKGLSAGDFDRLKARFREFWGG